MVSAGCAPPAIWCNSPPAARCESPLGPDPFSRLHCPESLAVFFLAMIDLRKISGTHASTQPCGVEGGAVIHGGSLELLIIAGPGGFHGPGQQLTHLTAVERLEILHDLQVLIQHVHAVNAGDHRRGRKREGVGQALLWRGDLVLDDGAVGHGFHAKDGDSLLEKSRNDMPGEAPETGVEQIERHLATVEMEVVLGGDVQHPVVDDGILVAGEANVADFAGILRLLKGFNGPPSAKQRSASSIRRFSWICMRSTWSVCSRLSDSSIWRAAACLVRPSILVMRKTFSR